MQLDINEYGHRGSTTRVPNALLCLEIPQESGSHPLNLGLSYYELVQSRMSPLQPVSGVVMCMNVHLLLAVSGS